MSREHLIGMAWNFNEGDILEETLTAALEQVDSIFVADGGSTDRSWDIIQSLQKRYPDKIESIQQEDETHDRAQRNSLLNKIRARYKPENTWVQVFESDMFVLDTDIRAAVQHKNLALTWTMLNAVRKPGTWMEADEYPNWSLPIREVMPYAHYMERTIATFRPLEKLFFQQDPWRPHPVGWTQYTKNPVKVADRSPGAPLLLHCGVRGPKHFHEKYRKYGKRHPRYRSWRVDSPENADRTVAFFNGIWNSNPFPASREGWINRNQKKDRD